ncbi:hypothetical protein GRI43_03335 [Altererythrobacter luteolus]|uniref:Terminase small subunit n=1 Tax=Pontixanthobacter luteolus TaxID=295089 RepID=A0A6I4UX29_9SPHN|nr:hypothetical protein [Pontixanthobacter luteolus]MXP46427.1 hypothetical protein [Pontixanthobacter luteolus]
MTRRTDPRTVRTTLPAANPAGQLPDFTPVPRQGNRHDGWTEQRQRAFIEALADTGSVHAACKAVDMSQPGAYYLRRQPGAESFRAAWQAALDLGVQRIEDTAMDRALNGVEVPVYSYGKLVGTRRVVNDRLLMFMLRNRAPERFAEGSAKSLNAVGKMELKRLKKQWRQEYRKEWEAEQQAGQKADQEPASPQQKMETAQRARQIIDAKLDELRQSIEARHAAEWKTLSPETRDAYRRYEELRARDLKREVQMPAHLASEEDIATEHAEIERAVQLRKRGGRPEETPTLPPPGWGKRKPAERPAEENPRWRSIKDDGWQ